PLTPAPSFSSTAPATPDIYTLSLHDALPILIGTVADLPTRALARRAADALLPQLNPTRARSAEGMTLGGFAPIYLTDSVSMMKADRKSTRLNSSHRTISYAVFCLKKKKKTNK